MFSGGGRNMLISALIVFSVSNSAFSKSLERITEQCKELSQKEKHDMLGDLFQGLHWSFLTLPPFQKMTRQIYTLSRASTVPGASETQIDGTSEHVCPTILQPGVKICPWYYVQQTDQYRIPDNIIHARCKCKKCTQDTSSILSGNCEEVKVDTLVWKRTNDDCEYKKQIEEVSVACACKTS